MGGNNLKLKSDKTREDRDMFAETCSSIINRVISFFILLRDRFFRYNFLDYACYFYVSVGLFL
jgi:hypothetical protein